jgi:hypothetical protein
MSDKSGIQLYLHCRRCLEEKTPAEVEVGVTNEATLVVWCRQHELPLLRLNGKDASATLLDLLGEGCHEPHPRAGGN